MKNKPITPTVDIVDHEEKMIKKSDDFIRHEGNLEKRSEEVSDTMKQQSKQVSAEIDRGDFGDALKDKGC